MTDTPQGRDELSSRRSFSVRMPEALYLQLEALSAQRGESMNKLVQTAVAALAERGDLAPLAAGADIHPKIARDAVRQGPEAIAPLRGLAKHATNKDQMALAAVFWAAAARLVTAQQGPAAGSQELAHSAAILARTNFRELTIGLLEEAVTLDPNNLDAVNRLGQLLHHAAQAEGDNVDRYREAARLLSRVTFVDDRARLFHGWSALYLARADRDQHATSRALAEIDEAMRRWAFAARDPKDRSAWERQIDRLRQLDYRAEAEVLIDFARQHARWGNGSDNQPDT
ncbi:MAG: hypothetical protein EPO13_10525 [Actinomycetota bacterium]|nr:MAG: hypothetical protein EPO13_10525 [Actinomycetota bacterium]